MRYEIKKLLFRKEVWIVFVLSIIALLILSFRQPWVSFSTIKSAHMKTAEYYSLSLDEAESKIAEDLKRYGNESDLKILEQMQKSVRSYKKQEENMKNLLANMYHEADHASTEYERRDLEHAIRQYNRRIDYHPCDVQQLNIAFLWLNDFEWLHYLFPLIICTLLAPLFAVESESGMYQILFISKKGKKQLFRNKIISGIICSACVSIIYTLLTFVMFWIRFGLSFQMLFAPIQCAEYYQNCPFSMTIWQFLMLTSLMRTIVGALLTALTAVISSLFNRTAIAFGATVGISGIFIMISRAYANEPDAVLMMKRLGLFRLPILGSYLTEYDTVNVFGYPVEQLWLSVACTCSVILVLFSVAYILYTLPVKEKRKTVKLCSASKS
ncbi:MAG: hypothetical protein IKG98_00105 [Ruminococcus sp.]|nr:hypothetical protein [Ruminococcus sp.]MBR3667730.1 hypothetical protein [Ruminococcus sp.]